MAASFLKTNFFALEKQDFEIPFYKRLYKDKETKDDFSFPVKSISLSINDLNNEEEKHWITFDEHATFIKDMISSLKYRNLTLSYIYLLIEKKIKNIDIPYQIRGKFMDIVDVIIGESELGKECICISPVYLNRKIGILLDYHFSKNGDIPYSIEMQKKSLSLDISGQSNKNYYADKYKKIEYFLAKYFDKIFVPLDEKALICVSKGMENIESYKLEKKRYVFGGGVLSNSQFQGILNHGPYSKLKEDAMLGFIYRNNEKSLSHELYYALRGDRFPTFKGMEKMFDIKIQKNTVIGYGVDDYNEQEIEKMVDVIIENSNGKKIVPIIIVPWNKNNATDYQSKIYYLIKFSFLKKNIACQFVDINKIKNYTMFKWSVSGMALQIFTKLGGSPWCLVPSTEKCLIIGIGQAHRKNEKGEIERYYAYSIQNDSSGLFKNIKLLSDNTDRDSYLNGLSDNLKKMITDQSEEFDNFVIHTPFRLRKDEMNTIRMVVESLANETGKKFAVLRFNDNHYYMGYDFGNDSRTPYESTFIRISANRYLVWFEGLQYGYSSVKERIGPPVLISIDFHQTEFQYTDILKYLQDAINLSGANWRGFNAKTMPVSILYAHLLSGFISAFDKYQLGDINVENITPWFL
jgi:flavodoxin